MSFPAKSVLPQACFRAILLLALLSLVAVPGPASAGQELLDDFSKYEDGSFPSGWKVRAENPHTTYLVRKKEGGYLEAKSNGDEAIQIGKGIVYLLSEYPKLSWEWRVVKLPKGGNETNKKTADSAAALYVILDGKGINKKWPRTIKYVWSASQPKGSRLGSPYDRKTKMVILQNQETPLNTWVKEKVDVLKDLEEFFPKDKGKVRGIAFMTDSDNTKSSTEAHIKNIIISSD